MPIKVGQRSATRLTQETPAAQRPEPGNADLDVGPAARPETTGASPVSVFENENSDHQNFKPLSAEQISPAVLDAIGKLTPSQVPSIDPMQLVDGVKEGEVTIAIPMKAGDYKLKGIPFTVEPNTVIHVKVDVKDGRLVPAFDKHGNETGHGTRVEITPPLDLPLWVTGRGAYLEDKGNGAAKIKAELGGFFDLSFSKMPSTKIGDVVRQLSAPMPGNDTISLPDGLIRPQDAKFSGEVTLADNTIKGVGASFELAAGTKVMLSGDLAHAKLSGDMTLKRATLQQDGKIMQLGEGKAQVTVEMLRAADGSMEVTARANDLSATIDSFKASRDVGAGREPDVLDITDAKLTKGTALLRNTVKIGENNKFEVTPTETRFHVRADGTLNKLKLTVKDAKDDAEVKVGSGTFSGELDMQPEGNVIDLRLPKNTLQVRDLQTQNKKALLDVNNAKLAGDIRLTVDHAQDLFDFRVDANDIDVKFDHYKGVSDRYNIDFGPTEIKSKNAAVVINSATGTAVDGELDIKLLVPPTAQGKVNELGLITRDHQKKIVLENTAATLKATHFHAGGNKDLELDATGTINSKVRNFDVAMQGIEANGSGNFQGELGLKIANGDASLVLKNGAINLDADDAKIAKDGQAMALDLGKSKLRLNVDTVNFSSAAGANNSIKLNAGSVIEGALDSGHVNVAGKKVNLGRGTAARFELQSGHVATGGDNPSIKGRLDLQGTFDAKQLGMDLGSVKLTPGDVAGQTRLSFDEVNLYQDGNVQYRGGRVELNARFGTMRPGKPLGSIAPMTPEVSPDGVLSQQAVNAAQSATALTGAAAPTAKTFNPEQAAKLIRNGTLEMEIPIEGKFGSGLKSATFLPGTQLKLQVKVVDGAIVPRETKASFTHPGDAIGPVEVKGVQFDENNSLKLQLSVFGVDLPNWIGLGDKFDKMPLKVDQFVERTKKPDDAKPMDLSVLKTDRAWITNFEATSFTPGTLDLPGGSVGVGPKTKLQAFGNKNVLTMRGTLDLTNANLDHGGLALKARSGSADVEVKFKKGVATTTLTNINVDSEYAVQKRANGDYIHLAQGKITNGSLELAMPMNIDVNGMTVDPKVGAPDLKQMKADFKNFSGEFIGGRITQTHNGQPVQVEIGKAAINGAVHIDGQQIDVRGTVKNADLALRGATLGTLAATGTQVSYARMKGDAAIDFSSTRGLNVNANVASMDVRSPQSRVDSGKLMDKIGRTRVTGKGQVQWSSNGRLSIDGDLHLDSNIEEGLVRANAPAQPAATKGKGKAAAGKVAAGKAATRATATPSAPKRTLDFNWLEIIRDVRAELATDAAAPVR